MLSSAMSISRARAARVAQQCAVYQAVFRLEQRVVGVWWFNRQHVEACARQPAGIQRVGYRWRSSKGPRLVFRRNAVGFISASRAALTNCRFSGVSGQCNETTSLSFSSRSSPTNS